MTARLHPTQLRTLYTQHLKPYLPSWQTLKADLWLQDRRSAANSAASSTVPFLVMLLLVDLGFIVAHFFLFYTDLLNNELFSLRKDQGYPELFQYIKLFWIGFLLVWQAWRMVDLRYLVWAALFGYMLADDYLMLHEDIGMAAANVLDIDERWGLRGQDFGEIGFYLLVGGLFLVLLVAVYYRGGMMFRRVSVGLVVLLTVFAVFAVAADMLHVVLPVPALEDVFDVVEDGGEMVVMSLVVWYVYLMSTGNRQGVAGAVPVDMVQERSGERSAQQVV